MSGPGVLDLPVTNDAREVSGVTAKRPTGVFDFTVTNNAVEGRVTTKLPNWQDPEHVHLMWNAPEVVADREEMLQARAAIPEPEDFQDFIEKTFRQKRRKAK